MRGSFADSVRKVATSTRIASATRSARRVLRRCPRCRSQRAGNLLLPVAFEHVANLDVVEILHANSALEALADFLDVILEATQRSDRPVVDLDAVPHHANATLAVDDTAADRATGDHAHARNLEQLAHLGFAEHRLALFGPQHAFEGGADVFDRLVNDLVELDVHAFALGCRAGVVVRPDV